MFIKIGGKKFWLKVVGDVPTLSFICEATHKEYVVLSGGTSWTLQDMYNRLVFFASKEEVELIKLAKEILW